ncbi:hypothetical protein CDAR_120201 [Caerostris darwini]|uniref:Uncharacterized protein n=1 Tax=Caerostris darwini TaxID=1538125 RepID=A0AAV4UQ02_9ARAC|nr:hypothetical protein CDAR_120201 [Caerostris darwini]
MRTVSPPNKLVTRFSSWSAFLNWMGVTDPKRNESKFSVLGFFSFRWFSSSGSERNNHFEGKLLEKLAERKSETVLIWLRMGTNSGSHSSISEGRKCEENENPFTSLTSG